MNLFVFGNIAIDKIYYVKEFPFIGETILSTKYIKDFGGKGFNQSISAARIGVNISFWTYLGIDNFKKIITTLEKEEISTKNIFTSDFKNDESIVVVNEKGDNYIISSIKNLCSMDLNFSNNMLKKIKGGDSLLLQGNLKKEITQQTIKLAYKKKVRIFLNASPITYDYLDILPYIDTLIVNENEHKQLTNNNNFNKGNKFFLENGVKNIITTQGKKGIIYSSKNDTFSISSPKVSTLDSTGAGDVFCGSLVAYILKGYDYRVSCEKAIKLASISVTKYGTYLSIPNRDEIADVNNLMN